MKISYLDLNKIGDWVEKTEKSIYSIGRKYAEDMTRAFAKFCEDDNEEDVKKWGKERTEEYQKSIVSLFGKEFAKLVSECYKRGVDDGIEQGAEEFEMLYEMMVKVGKFSKNASVEKFLAIQKDYGKKMKEEMNKGKPLQVWNM